MAFGFSLIFLTMTAHMKRKKYSENKMYETLAIWTQKLPWHSLHVAGCSISRICCLFPNALMNLWGGWWPIWKVGPQDLISMFATQTSNRRVWGRFYQSYWFHLTNTVPVHRPKLCERGGRSPTNESRAFPREGQGVDWIRDWSKCMQIKKRQY